MLQNLIPVIKAVEAVEAFKAKRRIDFPTRPGVTFFSESDRWLFNARSTGNVCERCRMYETWSNVMGGLRGDQLRTEFPFLVIIDEITIAGPEPDGRGLVHPHCYCYLSRLLVEYEKV